MQPQTVHSFADHKKNLERMIIDTMTNSLEKQKLAESELQTISKFVLEHIDRINNHQQLVSFVDQLSAKWPIFLTIDQIERGEEKKFTETEAAKTMLNLIKNGKSNEALIFSRKLIPLAPTRLSS